MQVRKAPMWQFHKELCPEGKIFRDEAELQALSPEWVDSPTMFEQVAQGESPLKVEEIPPGEPPGKLLEELPSDLASKTNKELQALLLAKGKAKKDLIGKNKAALIAMVVAA